jgi:hypothetical protein
MNLLVLRNNQIEINSTDNINFYIFKLDHVLKSKNHYIIIILAFVYVTYKQTKLKKKGAVLSYN